MKKFKNHTLENIEDYFDQKKSKKLLKFHDMLLKNRNFE